MSARARTLTQRARTRLERAEHVLDALVVVLSTVAGGIGLSMLWVPQAYTTKSFRVALDLFPAHVWGGVLLLLAGMTVVALRGDRQTLAACIGGQVIVWSAWGVCLIWAVAAHQGVPSGAIVYTGLSWACFILAVYYWLNRDRVNTDAV